MGETPIAESQVDHLFVVPPDPARADSLDAVAEGLRQLKVWAGDPSYDTIKERINTAWRQVGRPSSELARRATVADCFKAGRRRLNTDLVVAIVRALYPDAGYVTLWRQALRVIGGEARAASQVRVQDRLPQDLAGFTGRTAEIDLLRRALRRGDRTGDAVVISAIAGMAGVGKTQFAVHAGHLFAAEGLVDRVLFVNLRGFHPGPAQPPADPGAVLDGFLRLLGVPGQQIPHDLPARTELYRARLAGTRTLVVLDNAATAGQVRPLLPATPGCPALITSRRDLAGLDLVTHLTVDVFTADEAAAFLTRAVPHVPAGADPRAAARIARRCGYLPLALGLVAGHIRGASGWTLTEHADRLDERHRDQRLDTDVQLAVDLSYQHVSAAHQRLLRLATLHPAQDFDAYAVAALTGGDLLTVRAHLRDLHRDHLVQQSAPDRYTLHDLIRAYAAGQAGDEDPPSARQAARTRLFDYYLAAAAAATDTLYPAEAYHRPRIPPPGTPTPDLAEMDAAVAWLNSERPALVAVAEHTAAHGWPAYTTRLSTTLYRYLDSGHVTDALAVHAHALPAAVQTRDLVGQAHARNGLGTAHLRLGEYGPAADHLRQGLRLFEKIGDPAGQARILGSLGNIEKRLGRFPQAIDYQKRAWKLFRQAGDRAGEARALRNLGLVEGRLGRYEPATEHLRQALAQCRSAGDQMGTGDVLAALGEVELRQGRYEAATENCAQAIALFRQLGDHTSAEAARDDLGIILTRLGRPEPAIEHHEAALASHRATGDRDGEAIVLNGLGEAVHATGRFSEARTYFAAAAAIAAEIGLGEQDARAHAGLALAHQSLDQPEDARRHNEMALTQYTDLGMPEADEIRVRMGVSVASRG
jgi:tetratricopeptide (TPR) repeat protein